MIGQMKKIIIIGGGILGLAIARRLMIKGYKNLIILEKDKTFANHQSSRNSGVMHSGLYYNPKSLKAHLSRKGILLLKNYCNNNSIQWEECGKVVVATELNEIERLENLFVRGQANGLRGIKKLDTKEVNSIEPYVNAKAGIFVPEESIVNYKEVANKYKEEIISLGGSIKYSARVIGVNQFINSHEIVLENGEIVESGKHNELKRNNKHYSKLYKMQFSKLAT